MAPERFRMRLQQRLASILLFSYGIIVGTSTPIILARCASSASGCAACGGICALGLGVLPLVLFVTLKARARRAGGRLFSQLIKAARHTAER